MILFKEFLNVVNEENLKIHKGFPRVGATVVYQQLEGVATGYGSVATSRR